MSAGLGSSLDMVVEEPTKKTFERIVISIVGNNNILHNAILIYFRKDLHYGESVPDAVNT